MSDLQCHNDTIMIEGMAIGETQHINETTWYQSDIKSVVVWETQNIGRTTR